MVIDGGRVEVRRMPLVLPPPRTNISFKAHIIVLPCSMTVRVYAHNLHTTYTQHNTLNNGEHKSRRCMGGDRDR